MDLSGLTVQHFSMKIAASSWKLKRAHNVKNKGWVKKGMSGSVTFQNNGISLNILRLCHINWIWEFDVAANCLTFQSTAALLEKIKNHILYDIKEKHCQRHNGPEDWVHLAKVTFEVISRVQTQILITFHHQNLD